jgi:hypothetical protein
VHDELPGFRNVYRIRTGLRGRSAALSVMESRRAYRKGRPQHVDPMRGPAPTRRRAPGARAQSRTGPS